MPLKFRYHPNLSKAVTHLVVSSSALRNPSDKLRIALCKCESGAWRLVIVEAQWLRSCVTERRIVDWIPFQVDMTHAQSGKIRTQTLHVLQPINVNEPRSQTLHVVDGSPNSTAKELPKQGCDHRLQGRAFARTGPDGATGDVEQCVVLSFIPL
jgi:hypothetical protein